ncbi:MAG: acyltransferase [Muribaculaceae bacterium]|nr:acyltransferase [Muribaculaceae bacterium]
MPVIRIFIGRFIQFIRRAANSCQSSYQLSLIKQKGKNCHINGPGYFTFDHIQLGNGVHIGTGCTLMAAESRIIIRDNVIVGRHSHIIGGDHRFDIVGKTIKSIHEKRPQDDADIIIDEECWIGANCIILKGVHIGRGCVVGAGSIVTKDIPPYTIYTNKGKRPRFSQEQIAEHERIIYNSQV